MRPGRASRSLPSGKLAVEHDRLHAQFAGAEDQDLNRPAAHDLVQALAKRLVLADRSPELAEPLCCLCKARPSPLHSFSGLAVHVFPTSHDLNKEHIQGLESRAQPTRLSSAFASLMGPMHSAPVHK